MRATGSKTIVVFGKGTSDDLDVLREFGALPGDAVIYLLQIHPSKVF